MSDGKDNKSYSTGQNYSVDTTITTGSENEMCD
jgi:hypothetical protein